MRFQIDRTPAWRWLLALFGATEARSYVDVREREVEVRFGFFHQTIPLTDIRAAEVAMRKVPWYAYSIGWRTNLMGAVGLIGAARNVVKLSLAKSRRVFIGLPVECRELYVSMEQPDALVAALQPRLRA